MPNIIDILARAQSLMNETALNSITPPRAGGIMYDTLLVLNQVQLEGASLLISKVYASVSAMEADTTPTSDLTGRALKPGQLVVIVTSDTSSSDMGSEYRYNGTGSWTYVGKVGGLPLDTVPTQGSTKGITSGGVYDSSKEIKKETNDLFSVNVPNESGYHNTNASSLPSAIVASTTVQTASVECSPGDVFIIYGKAASSNYYRLWALYDSSKSRVDRYSSSGDFRSSPYVLTIPSGVKYVVFNLSDYDALTDKIQKVIPVRNIIGRITEDEAAISNLRQNTIHLSKWGITFTLEVGQYGYKSDTKELKYNSESGLVTVPFNDGAVYRYGSSLYYWDSGLETLAKFYAEYTEKTTALEGKIIHLSKWGTTFTLEVGQYGYKRDTKVIRYNTGSGVVDVPFYDGAVYRFGSSLYYWDAVQEEMTVFFPEIETMKEDLKSVGLSSTVFEVGSLITSSSNFGKPPTTLYTNRARSTEFVLAPFKFACPAGYRVFYVFAYDLDAVINTSQAVSATNYSSVNVSSIDVQDKTKKYRIVLSKEDSTQDVDVTTINSQSEFKSGLFLDDGGVGFGRYYACTNYPSRYTSYSSLITAYDELVEKYPDFIAKTTLGSDGQGTPIFEYTIKTQKYNSAGRRGTLDQVDDKPLVAIMAGVHGGEKSTVNGLFFLVRDILDGAAPVSTILGNMDLRIIPCVCPYGFDNNSRTNANGVNINRNFDADWASSGAGTNDYSGPSAASEAETQIAQTWLQSVHDEGAILAVDWHNSGYSEEISCFCTKSNLIQGTMDIKKSYLFSVYSIVNVLRDCYKVPDTANWGYTAISGGAGFSNTYMDKIGQLGCYFETSYDVDGAGSYTLTTDACGASVMGNVLIGLGELFKI